MNVDILSSNENKLLDRREIKAEIFFDGATPKRAELKQAVGGKLGINPDLMALRSLESAYGKRAVKVVIHAYPSKEKLMATEPNHIKIREGLMQKEEKKKAEAPKKK